MIVIPDKFCEHLPAWLDAIGTVGACIIALFFGLCGNFETRALIKKVENELDQDAFEFLTEIPSTITSHIDATTKYGKSAITTREFISTFQKKIFDNIYISKNKKKQYRSYIELANEFSKYPVITMNDSEKTRGLLDRIMKEAKALSPSIDDNLRIIGMRKLWWYEKAYWSQDIYLIEPETKDKNHPAFLIYSDVDNKSDLKSIANARKITQEFFNENYPNLDQELYNDETRCYGEKFSIDEYELIQNKDNFITIIFKGNKIKLKYNEPHQLY